MLPPPPSVNPQPCVGKLSVQLPPLLGAIRSSSLSMRNFFFEEGTSGFPFVTGRCFAFIARLRGLEELQATGRTQPGGPIEQVAEAAGAGGGRRRRRKRALAGDPGVQ